MIKVKNKYRGTTTYFRVMAELIRAAEYRGLTTYQDIAVLMGLPITGNYMQRETGQMCGEISDGEVECGRPMLSAVVVSVMTGMPSFGFFEFARNLGRLKKDDKDEKAFWEQEREAVYQAWKRPLRKK
jgi:hypothetical protein